MFEMVLFFLFFIALLYYFQRHKEWREKFSQFNKLPGPRSYPLIGNVWMLAFVSRRDRPKFIEGLIDKYGTLFKLWQGSNPLVLCANAEDAEIILSSRTNIEKSKGLQFLTPWLGTGLLTSDGKFIHLNDPNGISAGSCLHRLSTFPYWNHFFPSYLSTVKLLSRNLSAFENEKDEWNIFPSVHRFTFDVICETAMGVKLNIQCNESPEYLENVLRMSSIVVKKTVQPWWHNKYLYWFSNLRKQELKSLQVLHAMSMDVIQKNKQRRRTEKLNSDTVTDLDNYGVKKRKAFLDLLLDISEGSQIPLSDEDIREEVDTFMFAGHDTTTSGILSTIHSLSTHPEVQEKVSEELFSIFSGSDRDITLHDVSEMKYLECVIKESHRLLPPVPAILRVLTEAVTLGGKYLIPAGTLVQVNIYHIHRQKTHFPEPRTFNPNNFAAENARRRHPFAFVPFSAGPRNCVGQKFALLEEKILLSSLIRKYEIKSSQNLEDLGLVGELVLRHDNGVRVRITPRLWKNSRN